MGALETKAVEIYFFLFFFFKWFGSISAKSRKKKVISAKNTTEIIIRSFLNIVELHLDAFDVQFIEIHCTQL